MYMTKLSFYPALDKPQFRTLHARMHVSSSSKGEFPVFFSTCSQKMSALLSLLPIPPYSYQPRHPKQNETGVKAFVGKNWFWVMTVKSGPIPKQFLLKKNLKVKGVDI